MSNINVNISGTNNFLFWKNDYSKDKEISAEEYIEFQREQLSNKDVSKQENCIVHSNGKTYTFYDKESINQSLWEIADKNADGNISQEEYKEFLAYSISDGIIGHETEEKSSNAGMVMSATGKAGVGVGLGTNIKIEFSSDYSDLINTCDIYGTIKEADKNIDTNNDGQISKEEFNNSMLTKLITNIEEFNGLKKSYADTLTEKEKEEIISSISNGTIGKVTEIDNVKTAPVIVNGQTTIGYAKYTETKIEPDYESLINVAEEYNRLKQE